MMKFYEVIDDGSGAQGLDSHSTFERNKITCYDTIYNTSVSLTDHTNYEDLDSFILHRVIFRRPVKLTEMLWTAAIKRRQPLLVYLRDKAGQWSGLVKNQYHVLSKEEDYEKAEEILSQPKTKFLGSADVIDFTMYQSY